MKLAGADVMPYRLRFTRPLRTRAGLFAHRQGWLVRLRDEEGLWGSGDAAPWPGFGSAPSGVERQLAELVAGRGSLFGVHLAEASHVEACLADDRSMLPEVRHALELALLDLLARHAQRSVARLLTTTPRARVATHRLIDSAVAAGDAARGQARTLKLKVGAATLEEDDLRVMAVRAAVGDDVALRLDANGAWAGDDAVRAVERLGRHGVEWIEQPVPPHDLEGMRRVRERTGVPVAADESVTDRASLEAILALDAADVVVVKPMFAGGLLASRTLAARATGAGLRCVVTHALESAVGRAGAIHLAAALPEPLSACGLADPGFGDDLAVGVGAVTVGHVTLPDGVGLGVAPRLARLPRHDVRLEETP